MVMVKCMEKWRDSSLLKQCNVIESLFKDKIHLTKNMKLNIAMKLENCCIEKSREPFV